MSLNKLYDQIYTDESSKDSNRFIEIYEAYQGEVETASSAGDKETHDKVMRLTADYAHHLTLTESYKKALPQIERAIELFESYSEFEHADLYSIKFYEILRFDRAVANYYLENYQAAMQDLHTLKSKFPTHDKYKTWFAAARIYPAQKLLNGLWYIIAAVLLIIGFFERKDMGVFYEILLLVGIAAILAAIAISIVIWMSKRSLKNGD